MSLRTILTRRQGLFHGSLPDTAIDVCESCEQPPSQRASKRWLDGWLFATRFTGKKECLILLAQEISFCSLANISEIGS